MCTWKKHIMPISKSLYHIMFILKWIIISFTTNLKYIMTLHFDRDEIPNESVIFQENFILLFL